MANVIVDRVAYFLKDFPPFDLLPPEEVADLSDKITVRFYRPKDYIFKQGADSGEEVYVLRKGNVKLFLRSEDNLDSDQLVDQCEPGDIFGVRSILSGKPYVMSAYSEEESLIYAIPKTTFRHYLDQFQNFALFFAQGYASGQVIVRSDQNTLDAALKPVKGLDQHPLQFSENVLTCTLETSIYEAATLMKSRRVGSIIIADQNQRPLGIVTDTDLRNKVVAQRLNLDAAISDIMSSPVQTVDGSASVSEVMAHMIKSNVHHLVATKDGTSQSQITGLISDHDVVLSQKNHPAALIKSIKGTDNVAEWARLREEAELLLKEFLDKEVSIKLISALISAINDMIIEKALIKVEEEQFGDQTVDFCWINLGSEGREEQLLRTDQDNAIIIADDQQHLKEEINLMAKRVNEILVQCGFVECPANIMAGNPDYCITLSEWKSMFGNWIDAPDPKALMNSTIFFDFRAGYGNKKLVSALEDYLTEKLQKESIFLNHLAANALQNPPPLSFFKGFVVERSGDHRDEFDIKKRAMMPLSDAARLLTLGNQVPQIKGTLDRFEHLSQIEPKNATLYQEAAQAYEVFMRHRAISGLKSKDSGRFVDVNHLNKLQKQELKNAFVPIKELQELISVRYQVAYFS